MAKGGTAATPIGRKVFLFDKTIHPVVEPGSANGGEACGMITVEVMLIDRDDLPGPDSLIVLNASGSRQGPALAAGTGGLLDPANIEHRVKLDTLWWTRGSGIGWHPGPGLNTPGCAPWARGPYQVSQRRRTTASTLADFPQLML